MGHRKLIKKSLLFFIILFFTTALKVVADDLKNNSNLSPKAKIIIETDPQVPPDRAYYYNVSSFGDLENLLGIPYYQIIAKALEVKKAEDIKFIYLRYPPEHVSIADVKEMIILDKGKEINNDLVEDMRNQILSEIIRYEKFLADKIKKELHHLPTANEFFINKIKVFAISGATYYAIYGHTTGYDVALWKDGTKLIFCTSTYSLRNFLKEYVGNISNLLKEYKLKVKEYIPYKLNENQRRAREKKLEYIRDFLETLK